MFHKLFLASSNPGKLREFQILATGQPVQIELLPGFEDFPPFEESAPTFAENAAGKALHYSRYTPEPVIADDSGLVVWALGGAPGVHSARYAGPGATDRDRYLKLLDSMKEKTGAERSARFVCVLALAQRGRTIAVFSASVDGAIAGAPRGTNGFGYDPVFYLEALDRTTAEMTGEEKNQYSHRGRAFEKLVSFLASPESTL
jgi:XTP/dITP diphosphohydrolase